MDVTAELEAPCAPEALFVWVEDLGRYPSWLDIVVRAEPVEPRDGDQGPAWSVDLRGRLGPFARTKRLRMVRTRHEPPDEVAFERAELDGRHHSPWTLRASVAPANGTPTGAEMSGRTADGVQADKLPGPPADDTSEGADAGVAGADGVDTAGAAPGSGTLAAASPAGGPSRTTKTAAGGSVPTASKARHASVLTMRLHYGGTLVDTVVERLLAEEIRRSKPRLLTVLGAATGR